MRSGRFWSRVRTEREILATLDQDGTLNGLPFMPRCSLTGGRTFRVRGRAGKTCVEVAPGDIPIRGFRSSDVVFLDDLRCSGLTMRNVSGGAVCSGGGVAGGNSTAPKHRRGAHNRTRTCCGARLQTRAISSGYRCQSTELRHVTETLTRVQRLQYCLEDLRSRSRGFLEMVVLILARCGGSSAAVSEAHFRVDSKNGHRHLRCNFNRVTGWR